MRLKQLKKSLKKLALKSNLNNFTYFYRGGNASLFNFYKDAADVRLFTFFQTYTNEVEYAK